MIISRNYGVEDVMENLLEKHGKKRMIFLILHQINCRKSTMTLRKKCLRLDLLLTNRNIITKNIKSQLDTLLIVNYSKKWVLQVEK